MHVSSHIQPKYSAPPATRNFDSSERRQLIKHKPLSGGPEGKDAVWSGVGKGAQKPSSRESWKPHTPRGPGGGGCSGGGGGFADSEMIRVCVCMRFLSPLEELAIIRVVCQLENGI